MARSHSEPSELLAQAAWIRGLARRLVRDREAAEDLAQDTWLAALRSRPDPARPLRPWLARVARNLAGQAGRRRAARPVHEGLAELDGELPSPQELAERGELQARLVRHVLELREPFRSTVLLRFYEGLRSEEIARRLGIERATVRSRLKRAVDELRVRLDTEHGGDRRAWVQALVPLTAPPLLGALMKTTTGKSAATAAALLLMCFGGYRAWRHLAHGAPAANEVDARAAALPMPRAESAPPAAATPPPQEPARSSVVAATTSSDGASAAEGRWSARLLDDRTGEALPDYLLTLRTATGDRELRSDAGGRVATAQPLPFGALQLRLRDHDELHLRSILELGEGVAREETWRAVEHAADGPAAAPLAVSTGPTYELELRSPVPVDPESLAAVLVGHDFGFRDTVGSLYAAPVRVGGSGRGGNRVWVRFMPLPLDLLPREGPWRLEVYERGGTWLGAGDVHAIVGRHDRPVVVELEEHARVRGNLADDAGLGVAGVALRLIPLEEGSDTLRGSSGEDGRFELGWIPPGAYRLEAEPPRHAPLARELRVRRGETRELELRLEPRPTAGDVAGRLRSRTGTYANNLFVMLDGRGEGLPDMNRPVSWREASGELVAEFRFEDLPPGEYVVSVLSLLDKFRWSPGKRTVRPPATDLVFEVADDVPTRDVTFEVVDRETGEPVEPFSFAFSANGAGSVALRGMGAEGPHLHELPEGGTLLWAVAAAGYASAYGDEADLVPGSSGTAHVRVELERGWGARFVVVDGGTQTPVAGATIELDGAAVGTTDEEGRARVFAPTVPSEVRASIGERSGKGRDYDELRFVHPIVLPAE